MKIKHAAVLLMAFCSLVSYLVYDTARGAAFGLAIGMGAVLLATLISAFNRA